MADADWVRIAVDGAIGLASGLAGMIMGAFRFGRQSVEKERNVKDDYSSQIRLLRDEVRRDMASLEKLGDESRDLLVDQFKETLEGLRRQFDDHKFYTEKDFMKKDDFKDFMKEYREDMRELKKTIGDMKQ